MIRPRIRFGVVTAAVLAAIALAGCSSLTASRPVAAATATAGATAEVSCPASTRWPDSVPRTSLGDLAPQGATGAVLCAYALPHDTQNFPLTGRTPVRGDPAGLIDYLNGLPVVPMPTAPDGSQSTNMCSMMDTTVYVTVIHYVDRDLAVQILPPCGIVWTEGAAKRYPSLSKLLVFFGTR